MKKEGNKKMPTPRQKAIHNPIPTSFRRGIGSETTDNLSEDYPVKNAHRASGHVLILTHPYIFVMLKTVALFVIKRYYAYTHKMGKILKETKM